MLTVEKLNQLSKEAYENAKSKGFYNRVEEPEERVALLHSEISEAFEDFRNHKMELSFLESGKPIGFDSEIADICIRLLDLFGKHNQEFGFVVLNRSYYENESIPWWIYQFHHTLYNSLYEKPYYFRTFNLLFNEILLFCELYNIDIEHAIEVKMNYNKSRPFMHGGKAC